MHEFRRSMQGFLQNKWQHTWVIACLVLMAVGWVFSRALLSVASVAIAVPWFLAGKEKQDIRNELLGILLMMLPVLYSGIWSDDTAEWKKTLEVRIPMITLLLGIRSMRYTVNQWLLVSIGYTTMIAAGCIWSLCMYVADAHTIHAAYLKAKVLPTLADHDYVRFSWMVALAVWITCKAWQMSASRKARYVWIALAVFFVVYLHILAAKTGLLCLYTGVFVYIIHLVWVRKQWKYAVTILALLLLLSVTAYQLLPTLRNRVQYIRYDFSLYAANGSAPGYNDAARWLSVKAGYHILRDHPVSGVGFGDTRKAVNDWHNNWHPQSLSYERFLPACEWMVYGTGSGWPGMLLFSAGIFLVLFATTRRNIVSVMIMLTALIPVVFDDTLEGQLGVTILAFIAFFVQNEPARPERK